MASRYDANTKARAVRLVRGHAGGAESSGASSLLTSVGSHGLPVSSRNVAACQSVGFAAPGEGYARWGCTGCGWRTDGRSLRSPHSSWPRRSCMSHHFDTKLAKEDPSLNLCDFYLFDGPSGKTVMAMTVNPDVGLSAPDTLHPEGLYAFRFDLNGDAREEVTFKFRFGEPRHGDGSEHTHIQPFVVRRATGDDALRGDAGESLVEGETGSVATDSDLRAYVGIAPELFAANAGFGTFMTAFYKDQRFDGDAFLHQQNPFSRRNVMAIVLEVTS